MTQVIEILPHERQGPVCLVTEALVMKGPSASAAMVPTKFALNSLRPSDIYMRQ